MRFDQVKVITDGDMSGATVVSYGIDLQQLQLASFQAIWTGSPVGNFTLECSNDIAQVSPGVDPSLNVTNWSTYTGSTVAAGGGAGDVMYNVLDAGFRWVRLKYTKTSGTGTVNATFFGKGP
jgi:hypothetical protein